MGFSAQFPAEKGPGHLTPKVGLRLNRRFANKRFSQSNDKRCWHVCERSPSRCDHPFIANSPQNTVPRKRVVCNTWMVSAGTSNCENYRLPKPSFTEWLPFFQRRGTFLHSCLLRRIPYPKDTNLVLVSEPPKRARKLALRGKCRKLFLTFLDDFCRTFDLPHQRKIGVKKMLAQKSDSGEECRQF